MADQEHRQEYGWVLQAVADRGTNETEPDGGTFLRLTGRGVSRCRNRHEATHVASRGEAEVLKAYVEERYAEAGEVQAVEAGPAPEGDYVLDVRRMAHGRPEDLHASWIALGPGGAARVKYRESATAFADRESADHGRRHVMRQGGCLTRDEVPRIH